MHRSRMVVKPAGVGVASQVHLLGGNDTHTECELSETDPLWFLRPSLPSPLGEGTWFLANESQPHLRRRRWRARASRRYRRYVTVAAPRREAPQPAQAHLWRR